MVDPAGSSQAADSAPLGLVTPTIDGEETSYFEWLGAGAFEVQDVAGAMHRAEGLSGLTPGDADLIEINEAFAAQVLAVLKAMESEKFARKVLRRAVELGVNFIDTADSYGPEVSELLIAEALHPYPKELVIASKGGLMRPGPGEWVPNGRPEYLTKCVDGSLKRLQLERIDLYQLHRIDDNMPVEDQLGALKKMQDAGKIRHVGLSEVTPKEIDRARKVLPIVSA